MSTDDRRPDSALLAACQGGDTEAFGVFYVRHREAILAYLARRAPSPEIAADLLAESFAAALVAVASQRDPPDPAPAAPRYRPGQESTSR